MDFLAHNWFYIFVLALFVGMHLTGFGWVHRRVRSRKPRRGGAPRRKEDASGPAQEPLRPHAEDPYVLPLDLNLKKREMHMGRARRFAVFAIVAVVTLAVGYVGRRVYRRAQPEQCYACQRPIHAHSRTVAFAKGSSRVFCCPACALSEHEQESKPVRIAELTAFLTGAKLSPDDAYLVRGSDVNMCAHTHELIDADKRSAGMHYDRCAPSLLAFAREGEAQQFSREHGGTVLPFREVAAAFSK